MSYLVLARRWRPQFFQELLGQEHVCQTLQNSIQQNRIAHAFLFCGPRGIGKTSAARILAKTLICPNSKAAIPCNQCSICKEISNGTALDVIEIDGASNNGVDSIRELRQKAHYLPTQGKNKVYIIDEVHMLSQSAFNALLKTLEEPPPHLKFIFATTEPHKIPATILSRCQRFDFRKIPLKQLFGHLEKIVQKENISAEKDALVKIAKEARGSFRDALSLLDQASSYASLKITLKDLREILGATHEDIVFELLEKIFKKEASAALTLLSEIYAHGQDVKQLASELLEHLRSVLLIKVAAAENSLLDLTDHEYHCLTQLAQLISQEEIEQAVHIMLKNSQDMATTRYPQFAFETALIKLLNLRPLVSIDDLLARVESLQKLLGAPSTTATPVSEPSRQPSAQTNDHEEWSKMVEYIRLKKPALAAILEHGYFVGQAHQTITLSFPKDSVFYKLLSEKENSQAFERIVSEYLNSNIHLLITEMSADRGIGLTSLVEKNEDEISRLKQKALDNQAVKKAQKLFDGKILDVKVEKIKKEFQHE